MYSESANAIEISVARTRLGNKNHLHSNLEVLALGSRYPCLTKLENVHVHGRNWIE